MVQSAFYILVFVFSIVRSAPNSYSNSISGPDESISNSKADEAGGVMDYVFGGVRINWHYIGKLFCCVMCCKMNENEDERLDKRMLPESFDPRKAWPHCSDVISYIRNQGGSTACSIIAVTSTLSDRLCIAAKGMYKKSLSSEDVMRCCKTCLSFYGYNMKNTLDFLKSEGTVTGGEYNSGEGCIPFSFPPKNHEDFPSRGNEIAKCDHKCSNAKYSTPYEKDKYFITGYKQYDLPEDTAAIKAELMKKGSCIAGLNVNRDYLHYKGGIYTGEGSELYGFHAIRLIGWGKENGIEYWLIANSWGKDWGEDGLGKLKKGCCGLGEADTVWCVDPKVPDTKAG